MAALNDSYDTIVVMAHLVGHALCMFHILVDIMLMMDVMVDKNIVLDIHINVVDVVDVVGRAPVQHLRPTHIVTVVHEAIVIDTVSAVASPSNEDVATIKGYFIAKDFVAIVEALADRVAIEKIVAINDSTVVDIPTVSTAISFVWCTIDNYTITIENNVVGKDESSRRRSIGYFANNTKINSTMVLVAHLMGNAVCVFNVMVNNVLVMNIMVNKMFVMDIMVHMVKMIHMMVHFVMMVNMMINIVNMVNRLMS